MDAAFLFYGHDDGLREVAEVLAEQVEPALVFRVLLDPDLKFDSVLLVQSEVGEGDLAVDQNVVHKHAVPVDGDSFEQSELRARHGPIGGGIFAAASAEVTRGGEGEQLHAVDAHRDVGGPVVVEVDGLRTDLEGKGDLATAVEREGVGGEEIADKSRVEPDTFRARPCGGEKDARVVETFDGALLARHAAGRLDIAGSEHPERHLHRIFLLLCRRLRRDEQNGKAVHRLGDELDVPLEPGLIGEVDEPRVGEHVDVAGDA